MIWWNQAQWLNVKIICLDKVNHNQHKICIKIGILLWNSKVHKAQHISILKQLSNNLHTVTKASCFIFLILFDLIYFLRSDLSVNQLDSNYKKTSSL